MKRNIFKTIAIFLVIALMASVMYGCTNGSEIKTSEDAIEEMNALLTKVRVTSKDAPIDISDEDEVSPADALADISTYPLVVKGNGAINIEIAASTELSTPPTKDTANDNWMIVLAEKFNSENHDYNGKKVTITVRKITSGDVVTYMRAGAYQPDLYVPSNEAWGKMLNASGIRTTTLCNRLLGNTAGILISDKVYDKFIEKYGEASVKTAVEATLNGDLNFAYTNPYMSSTGLNMLTMILKSFDPENPLSSKAAQKLQEYQKTAPPTAYTTGILKNKAANGVINAMVMEEQAYILVPQLSSYIYIPDGIRHDHPVFTFDYVSSEKQEAAKLFIDYCLTDEAQKIGYDKGFNRHDEFKGNDPGIDGMGYLEAQSLWKQNKDGNQPVIAVFIADVSGSMQGAPLSSLQNSLIKSSAYISSENYIGLISYADNVTINLPIGEFDATQKAKFTGAVKSLSANGSTATYDALLQGLKMVLDKQKEMPDAKVMLFVLTDGAQNVGASYSRIKLIVSTLKVPVYTIGYNMTNTDELEDLAGLNEATLINASTEDVINHLRNLFNSQL